MINNMKNILIKAFCVLSVTIMLIYVAMGFLGGFNLKSLPCGGGYYTSFFQNEIENIKHICKDSLAEGELQQIKNNLKIDKNNGRVINTKYINENGELVELKCTMKWYWSNNYAWSVS